MITVNVKYQNKLIKEVSILGHADYAKYGQDIVCSAVSTMVTTTINDILCLDNNSITYKSKEGNVLITNNDNEIANKLLNVMLNSLKELAKDYPKNIEIGG
jgi:uncharacterized protein YsxB (DUF464 family)